MKKKLAHSLQPIPIVALVSILLAVFLVGSLNLPGVSASDFYKEGIAEVGFIGLLFYYLYCHRSLQKVTFTLSATRLFLAGLLLLATASAFWATNSAFFVSKYLLWLASAAIFLLTLTLPVNTKTHIVLARSLLFATTYISIIGLAQVFFALDIYSQAAPPAATFTNKNVAAQVVVLVFPLGCYLLCVDKNKFLARLYPFILALMLAYIFHTHTRSAWLSIALQGFLIALALIIFLCFAKDRFIEDKKALKAEQGMPLYFVGWGKPGADRLLAIGSILSASALLFFLVNISAQGWSPFVDVFGARVEDIVKSVESRGQLLGVAHRYRIWDDAFIMIANNPFIGSGMGSFFDNLISQSRNYHARVDMRTHNDVLELGVELGISGWVLLLGVVVGLLSGLYKLITQGEIQQRLFYLAIAIALAGSALNMQFSFPYQMPAPLMIFGLYSALIVKAGDSYNTKIKTIEWSLKPLHCNIGLGFVGLIVAFVVALNFIWLGAIYQMTANVKSARWQSPIGNPLVCHKTIVKTLYYVATDYAFRKKHEFSLDALDSFAQCVPNTWVYESIKGVNMIALRRYDEAIRVLERAKQHAPEGEYTDYVNQLVAYRAANESENFLRAYQQLSVAPVEMLITSPKILRMLTRLGLELQLREQAEKFYRLYHQHYGNNDKFEYQVGHAFKNVNVGENNHSP